MLVQFSVTNYRSFREENTLSLVAAKIAGKQEEETSLGVFTVDGFPPMLAVASLFGANASGKSNFLDALWQLRRLLLMDANDAQDVLQSIEPFRLNRASTNEPTRFEVIIRVDSTIYRYGIAVTPSRIAEEYLYSRTKSHESMLFERGIVDEGLRVGRKFGSGMQRLEEFTREDVPFLRIAATFNNVVARNIMDWFALAVTFQDASDGQYSHIARQLSYGNSERLVELIKKLDLSISDVRIERMNLDELRSEIASRLTRHDVANSLDDETRNLVSLLENYERNGGREVAALRFFPVHDVFDADGKPVGTLEFDFETNESQGTRRLFGLAGPIIYALEHGSVLVIDELDTRIHTFLARLLINLFQNPETNPNHAQLICTTHDTNLLDSADLRRDQIWFTDKNSRGESTLYSLAEFRGVRNDKVIERGYLKGEFGAVPIIKDLKRSMVGAYGEATTE